MALSELAVSDLALIERVRVALRPGFTVITGETGAGKSLLIDALDLVMGGRSDAGLVRQGASAARVEALFDRAPEPLICVREVSATGRTVARIDDEAVTVARLAATVEPLIEVHGQHGQQRLLSATWQRELLDAFGGHADLRARVAEAVAAVRANESALRELAITPDELARRLALAEHAATEIEAVAPRPGEVDELRVRLSALADAERLTRLTASVLEALHGDETGARDRLAVAAQGLREAARIDPRLEPFMNRLDGLLAEVTDAAAELHRAADAAASGSDDAAALEERLGALYGLLRKYGATVEEVLAHGSTARAEAERLRGLEDERRRREIDAGRLEAVATDAAAALSAARAEAAGRLGPAVTEALADLGLPSAAFRVDLGAAPIDATGADAVAFILAPNPGEAPRPLARIASGGELSRVSLAIKSVLAAADATPTLVFDEVDAGIGARSADPVGRRLWRLARDHQVLCVTHLAQIAAHADAHLRITKREQDGRTVTEVRELDEEERIGELAQMLGGSHGGPAAVETARRLLEGAAARAEAAATGPGR